ncbi:unnamed protein product [Ceutorhynchus assimilis]|uniref:Uncharacterized protein n=1 Tax=Ceutorhynchus assimilis TaxID=467358 RepID=A0A9N9MAX7_9CUCU|nr:unnamed protein product [Ceutorhynchus assimilis]
MPKCQEAESDNADRLTQMNRRLNELQEELEVQNKYIQRLKRNSVAFDEAVYEAENKFVSKLEAQKGETEKLSNRILELKVKEELKEKLQTFKEVDGKRHNEITELTELNRSMIITIEVLERDSEASAVELTQSRQQLAQMNNKSITITKSPRPE